MKHLLFLLSILPMSLYASGPFGISWGQSLTDFGLVINANNYQYVITDYVPEPYTQSTQYILIGNSDEGITGVKLKTKLSSYHCIIQAICVGKTWTGINADGTKVLLEKTGVSHSHIFISMFFSVSS